MRRRYQRRPPRSFCVNQLIEISVTQRQTEYFQQSEAWKRFSTQLVRWFSGLPPSLEYSDEINLIKGESQLPQLFSDLHRDVVTQLFPLQKGKNLKIYYRDMMASQYHMDSIKFSRLGKVITNSGGRREKQSGK